MRTAIRQHPIIFFFVFALGFSWLEWLPYILSQDGLKVLPVSLGMLAIIPGVFLGPALSSILVTGITDGKAGVRQLLRRFLIWRVSWYWYVFALLGIPCLLTLGAIVQPSVLSTFKTNLTPVALIVGYLPGLVLSGLLSGDAEEIGWRGFALPRLQKLHGPLLGTVILGLLWGVWHLPLFLTSFWIFGKDVQSVAEFMIGITAGSIVITWVFNHTKMSLLIATLLHGAQDAFSVSLLFARPHADSPLTTMIGFGVLAIVLIAVTRGRLGYKQPATDVTA
jgi:membrane protease YdiL (CAAX protease family)